MSFLILHQRVQMIMFQIPLPKVTAPSFTPTEMAILLDEVAHHKDNFFQVFGQQCPIQCCQIGRVAAQLGFFWLAWTGE